MEKQKNNQANQPNDSQQEASTLNMEAKSGLTEQLQQEANKLGITIGEVFSKRLANLSFGQSEFTLCESENISYTAVAGNTVRSV